eukprot:maker-scaffold_41-snap-gene-0.29-mRNA-1 protein AED:0.00 eAED:0.00 QI:0/1/0.5/1/1/1/2/172/646
MEEEKQNNSPRERTDSNYFGTTLHSSDEESNEEILGAQPEFLERNPRREENRGVFRSYLFFLFFWLLFDFCAHFSLEETVLSITRKLEFYKTAIESENPADLASLLEIILFQSYVDQQHDELETEEIQVEPEIEHETKLEENYTKYSLMVKEDFINSWRGYVTFAYGYDSFKPRSTGGVNDFGGFGFTLVDSLSTLSLMGYTEEVKSGHSFISKLIETKFKTILENEKYKIHPSEVVVNIFETNIRVLGGLLSSIHLTNDTTLIKTAHEIGRSFLRAFPEKRDEIDVSIPFAFAVYQPKHKKLAFNPMWNAGCSCMAEIGTLSLEFTYLWHLTKDETFKRLSDGLSNFFYDSVFGIEKPEDEFEQLLADGVFPALVDGRTGKYSTCGENQVFTVGARVDSLYEYFLKHWLQIRNIDPILGERMRTLYLHSINGIMKHLRRKRGSHVYIMEKQFSKKQGVSDLHRMDQFVCFLPGTLVTGLKYNVTLDPKVQETHLNFATELLETCYKFFTSTKSKLTAETITFEVSGALKIKPESRRSLLRPETIESLFFMYDYTGEEKYRDWAKNIYFALRKHCRVTYGFVGLEDVNKPKKKDDYMASYFMAETLKYLYLIFQDAEDLKEIIDLDKIVFNTEAHPLPVLTKEVTS